MKKICLFSTKAIKGIEGDEAELYVNFYLVLNRDYIFAFLINAPNLSCSDRHPIKLWKHFLIMLEEENVKYMRRYEHLSIRKSQRQGHWIKDGYGVACSECDKWYPHAPIAINEIKYCCECGAKMVEPQESEVNNG